MPIPITLICAGYALLAPICGFNLLRYKETAREYYRKAAENTARQSELSSLVSNVLKKAEFEDGERGLSLEDSAKMAYTLGVPETIKEGEALSLYVGNEEGWFPEKPVIWLQMGEHRDRVQISEERVRQYLR